MFVLVAFMYTSLVTFYNFNTETWQCEQFTDKRENQFLVMLFNDPD